MTRKIAGAASISKNSLEQFINLSDYVYTSGQFAFTNSLGKAIGVEPLSFDGSIVQSLDTDTGFYGEAFVTTKTATPKLIIAFQGTNPNPPSYLFGLAQAADDALIYAGQVAPSYATAESFTQTALTDAASEGISKANSVITGHSLGAAEAEYVAAETGLSGVTFGTPGIPQSIFAGKTTTLRDYVEQGDPVGNYSADPPRYLGSIVSSSSIRHFGTRIFEGNPSHSAILKEAARDYAKETPEGYAEATTLFGIAAAVYHPLAQYAKDLNLKLYTSDFSAGSDTGVGAASPICFAGGTRIRTSRGDVRVEALAVGDVVVTGSGAQRPIRWIGHRRIVCDGHPHPQVVRPIRIAAGTFGKARPERDLLVSPAHAICVDVLGEVLIPAAALVNGTTVAQLAIDEVTYWHVELESHDVILAENLPAESYLEMGNRSFFAEAEVTRFVASPDASISTHADFCRPFFDEGPVLDAVRAQLNRRAARVSNMRRNSGAVGVR